MTEQQFTLNEYDNYQYVAFDGDKPMMRIKLKSFGSYACFHGIIDKLNFLYDENELLKLDKTNLHQAMSRDRVKYLQFRDKVIESIDNKIKQFKESGMSNEAQILDDLRKELFE